MLRVVPDTNDSQEHFRVMETLSKLLVVTVRKMKHLSRIGWKDEAIAERYDLIAREVRQLISLTREES